MDLTNHLMRKRSMKNKILDDASFDLNDGKIMYKTPVSITDIHVYLVEPLEDPLVYVDVLNELHNAGPDDVFHFHINNPGGDVMIGIQLINAMKNSKATTVTYLESFVASMSAIIFMCGDIKVVNDDGLLMFHNFSGAIFGKGHEQRSQLLATTDWFLDMIRNNCMPFLTENEITRIERGEDLYINSKETRTRLDQLELVKQAKQKHGDQ